MLPGKPLQLGDILDIARRHIWLLIVPPIFTTFAALLVSSRLPSLYQSDMLIAIDPQRISDSYVRPTVTMPMDMRVDALTVQALSRTALQEIINDLDLYPELRRVAPMEDVIREMRSRVQVALERPREPQFGNSSPPAFHVLFTYTDPTLAAKVAQRIGLRFVDQNTKDRGALATAANDFLEARLNEARISLEEQETRLEAFRERHGKALPTQMQANMGALSNAQLQAQALVESIARDRDRKQMLDRLLREAEKEPPVTVASNRPDPLQDQLSAARAALTSAEQRYTPDHPDVARARRAIVELESKVAATGTVAGGATASLEGQSLERQHRESLRQMQAEIESLSRQIAFRESEEQRIRAEISDYQGRLEAVPGLESEWVKLTRDYDTQQAAYKELLAKSTQAKAAADLEAQDIGERFRIVDAANVPVQPLPSMRMQYNAGGLALGVFFGLALTAFLEIRNSSFRSSADVTEVLALPVLASIPYVATTAEVQRHRRRRLIFSVIGACTIALVGYVTWSMKLWKSLV